MRLPLRRLKFIDLFAGLGGFHLALEGLGHECVFASESDDELRRLYVENFPEAKAYTVGDITKHLDSVPAHDVLCAGFPCQPFSKSGYQDGHLDTRGTLFDYILRILDKHRPEYVFLENVGNFEQHDGGRTWAEAKKRLKKLHYTIVATEHVKSGGTGLISPHHLGYPHARERFYAVCRQGLLPTDLLPKPDRPRVTDIWPYLQGEGELTDQDASETKLTSLQIGSIDHWNRLHASLKPGDEFPSFPLWSDEFGSDYPYWNKYVSRASKTDLLRWTESLGGDRSMTRSQLSECMPSYARDAMFPGWKIRFIRQNRQWYEGHKDLFPGNWLAELRKFPSSYRKIEWNCKSEDRDLWKHVLQFRPSGIRVKRIYSIPALVALTTTQIPIIGPRRRYITRIEGLRFQDFPDNHRLPEKREAAFRALGNAVHVGVASEIAARLLDQESPRRRQPAVYADFTSTVNDPAAAIALG